MGAAAASGQSYSRDTLSPSHITGGLPHYINRPRSGNLNSLSVDVFALIK